MQGSFILTGHDMALPVASEVWRDVLAHRQSGDAVRLVAIRHTPIILTP
jgi:hypothetical protein